MVERTPVLVHRYVDGWLLGGFGIVAWLLISPLPWRDAPILGSLTAWLASLFVIAASAHFGASYHLAYCDGRTALRRNPVVLVVLPVVLLAASVIVVVLTVGREVGVASWLTRALLIVVFSATGWHYIKQAYGVAMLSLRLRGIAVQRSDVRLLRYGFYPIWFVDLMDVWASGNRAFYRRYDVGVGLLPEWVEQAARLVAIGFVVAVLFALGRVSHRAGRLPPMGAWAPYVSGALWFVMPPTFGGAAAMIGLTHALQYLACVHPAEMGLARSRGERHLWHWWLSVFGGALAGGVLIGRYLPMLLNRSTSSLALPDVAATMLFVGLNLHHYAIDASMWRSQGQHVRRITAGAPAPAVVPRLAPTPV
jgi:hypothetical protein